MKSRYEVRQIAESIIIKMGGDPNEICTGDCPEFAKSLVDLVGYGEIVSNLANAMKDDLAGYRVISPDEHWPNPDRRPSMSHCWVKIDGFYYDAFNPEGVDNEHLLDFYQNNV